MQSVWLLLPPSLREWLPEDHLAWFVLETVEELDLEAFCAAYRSDGWGAAAHEPQMMVALLLYAYAIGVRWARGIERRCRDDVAFRVITANQVPDHATIARFRARHEQAIADLFGGMLELCAKAGLVKVGVVAVDGTKIAAAATHHATRSYERIAEEILQEAARIDAAEDELYGEARGDELPEGLRTSGDRRKWLREAKQALEAERAAKTKPVRRSRGERLAECKRRLEADWELERRVVEEHAAWHARGIASDGSRRMAGARANIKPYPLPERPAGKLNVTDPDSRNLKTTRGWVQGYNAQAAVTAEQIVVAAEISIESLDTANLQPMVDTARQELAAAGVTDKPGVVLADAGYWKNDAIEAIVAEGFQTLVAPDADRRKEPRPGRRGGLYDFTRRVLATDWGKELYLKRQGSAEPSLRPDQVKPPCQPLLTPRQIGRQVGMAPADRDPQPAQAPPTPTRSHLRPGRIPAARKRPAVNRPAPAQPPRPPSFTRHPPWKAAARARVLGLRNRYCSADHSATLAQSTSCNACVTRTERFGRLG